MNPTVKTLIGAAVGGAVGYFVGQVIVEYIHMQDVDYHDTLEFDPTIDDEEVEELKPMGKEIKLRKIGKTEAKKNYDKMFQENPELKVLIDRYSGEESVILSPAREEEEYEGLRDTDDEEDVPGPISIISVEEFANTEDYQRLTLHYYLDDIVCDENDAPIDRPEQILGDDALVSFDEDDAVYVRNDNNKCMYEVVRLNQNYAVSSDRRSIPKSRGKKVIDYDERDDAN